MVLTLKLKHHIFLFWTLLLLWVLLTGSLAVEELASGLLVAAVVSLFSAPYLSILDGVRYQPKALISAFTYLGYFLVALVRANFDLARRVLSPSLPINPAIIEVETRLTSQLGRILLANSITLTPGTLTVDLMQQKLLVHWVAAPEDVDLKQATQEIVSGFEKHIGGFLQ